MIEIELKLLELQGHMIIQNQHMLASSSKNREETNEEVIVSTNEDPYINKIEKMISHKWCSKINLIIKDNFFELVALIDSRAYLNCI